MIPVITRSTTGQDLVAGVLRSGAEAIKSMWSADREPRNIERLEGDFGNGVVETMCELLNFQLPEYRAPMRELLIGIVNDTDGPDLSSRLLVAQAVFDAYPNSLSELRSTALSELLFQDSSFADEQMPFIRTLLAACRINTPRLT